MPPRRMNQDAIEKLIVDHVAKAIAQHEANRATAAEAGVVGPAGVAGPARGVEGGNVASEVYGCTYKSFLNCNPHTFSVIKDVVGLSIWFDKLELVFRISGCANENRVKLSTYTLQGRALTWWNGYFQTMGIDDGDDISGYTDRFYELTAMCPTMVTFEYKIIECYIWELQENIQGNCTVKCRNYKKIAISSKIQEERDSKVKVSWGENYMMRGWGAASTGPMWLGSTLTDIAPTTIDTIYDVELADGKVYKGLKVHQEGMLVVFDTCDGKESGRETIGGRAHRLRFFGVARAPYRLTPSEMKELSEQLQELLDKGFI
ncbi:hypothetical protein Tco_0243448 [Tanacetum coccineum]